MEPESTPARPLRLLALAIVLATGLLLLAIHDLYGAYVRVASGGVMASVADQIRSSPVTVGRIYAFAASVAILYLALGLVAWLLARLTLAAFRNLARFSYLLVVSWCLALGFLAGLINAHQYPWSRTGRWSRAVEDFLSFPVPLWTLMGAAVASAAVTMIVIWARRRGVMRHFVRACVWTLVALFAVLTAGKIPLADEGRARSTDPARPNIILIGIDSLRPGLVGQRDQIGYMPSLMNFVDAGHRFSDATTPLARTFPSWMAMLTGQRPVTSGVRENLMPRSAVNVTTLPAILGKHGYQTVFATDDVRFSNIDRSYGFESVLSPRIGVTDFLLGGLTDFPLVNLIANTVLAKWLFPDTYANRAAAVTYDPSTFVQWLDSDVRPDERPLFLAMHLTLAHYPYRWREDNDAVFSRASDTAYAYLSAVVEVDRQFAAITRMLEAKGILENALVIVFSDHGEGLNLPADREVLFEAADEGIEGIPIWSSGHGNTVLSDAQFEIFMAARSFGVAGYGESRGTHSQPVSIEDVAPTVLEVAGVDAAGNRFDGLSFASKLTRAASNDDAGGPMRVRFTESAYTTPALQQGVADEVALMKESVGFFRINQASGWVEVNDKLWTHFLDVRERAAIGATQLLAAVPAKEPGLTWYVLVPRAGGVLRKLVKPPGKELGEEVALLWQALNREYAAELGPPAP